MSPLKNLLLVTVSSLVAATAGGAAYAEDYLSLNTGFYDVIRHKNSAAIFGGEYRFSDISYGIHPVLGGFFTSDSGKYGYGGFNWAVPLIQNQIYLVPHTAVGAYSNGNGRRLGGTIEFRSGIELDYQFPNRQQIGVDFNHISNASIYTHNPGEENLIFNYSIPISTIVSAFH